MRYYVVRAKGPQAEPGFVATVIGLALLHGTFVLLLVSMLQLVAFIALKA